jgi:uncharacterized membrane protein YbhN (UPF0104 family)
LFASFISFTFSNNLGFALMSGSSVRHWIYTGFGLHPVEIGEVVAFCTLTYALGVTTVRGLMLLFDPAGMLSILNLPQPLLLAAGIAMLSVGVGYLVVLVARRGPIALWHYQLRLPSVGCGFMQFAVASLNQALAAGVVYVLLPPETQISFHQFLGVYVIATSISLLSLCQEDLGYSKRWLSRWRPARRKRPCSAPPSPIAIIFRVAACVGDPSGCDLRDAAPGARVGLASATAQRRK